MRDSCTLWHSQPPVCMDCNQVLRQQLQISAREIDTSQQKNPTFFQLRLESPDLSSHSWSLSYASTSTSFFHIYFPECLGLKYSKRSSNHCRRSLFLVSSIAFFIKCYSHEKKQKREETFCFIRSTLFSLKIIFTSSLCSYLALRARTWWRKKAVLLICEGALLLKQQETPKLNSFIPSRTFLLCWASSISWEVSQMLFTFSFKMFSY